MAKSRKVKKDARNRQWEEEVAVFNGFRENASEKKAHARRKGYTLPFFDYLDSYQEEFKKIGERAKREFAPYLFDVIETDEAMVVRDGWTEFGIPPDWRHLVYHVEQEQQSEAEQGTPGELRNVFGVVHTFRTPADELRLLVLMKKTVPTNVVFSELKYAGRIGILLHEIGHVRDIIQGRHFDNEKGVADPINAEVSANCYALEQCRKYGYQMSCDNFVTALQSDKTGFRGEVSKKTFETCDMTHPQSWQDFWDS
jgi:hypothetical protein